MKLILKAPYSIMWYSILAIFIIALFRLRSALDLQFHDTYYVFATFHIGLIGCLTLLINGLLYWWGRKYDLNPILTLLHIALTLFAIISLLFYNSFANPYISFDSHMHGSSLTFFSWIKFSFILGQCCLVINLSLGLLKRKKISDVI